jgi:KDO2-lipid IV(A) lauroyltransferase
VVFALAGGERRKALAHLAIAFPEKSEAERAALGRASFEQLGASALELTQLRKLDLATYVRWPEEQIAAARAALAPGNGGVLAFGHVGNWELVGPRLVASGFRGVAVGRNSGDAFLARRIEAFRKSLGVPIVGRGDGSSSLKEILKALRGGNLVAVLIDQDTRVDSLFVPFFGRLANTPKAAEDLARLSKGCCLIAFIHRESRGHALTTEVIDTQAPELTARLTRRIEEELRAHPSEWVWMHERWKRRPE